MTLVNGTNIFTSDKMYTDLTVPNVNETSNKFDVMMILQMCKVIRVKYAYNHIQVRPAYSKQG